MEAVHYVVKHPHTQQLLTLIPGRFASEEKLRASVGSSFFDMDGLTIQLDECSIVTTTARISDECRNFAQDHDERCRCVVCEESK